MITFESGGMPHFKKIAYSISKIRDLKDNSQPPGKQQNYTTTFIVNRYNCKFFFNKCLASHQAKKGLQALVVSYTLGEASNTPAQRRAAVLSENLWTELEFLLFKTQGVAIALWVCGIIYSRHE
jgi:hypothetical protein